MKRTIYFLLLATLSNLASAQDTLVIKRDLQIHLDALYKEDYVTYMRYLHPRAITMMGGKEKGTQMMKGVIDVAKKQGMTSAESSFGPISKLYPTSSHLYCTIPHTVRMNYSSGYLVITSTILGISDDKGKNWKYISAGKVPRTALKKVFPDLPDAVNIPPGIKPELHQTQSNVRE